MIDDLLAVERVAKLFTKQITKCDALLFSLSQDAIATMKKHNRSPNAMRCSSRSLKTPLPR
ncbi:hypothetical protein ACEN74_02965 [Helicobacter pylori]|uniref:hypothetical protein n=1 Tax=Helicobacter pylori TaxID=210 RepID=UPI00358DC3AB